MTVCGIELKASEALIALVAKDGQAVVHQPLDIKKLNLVDDEDASEVKAFYARLQAFVAEHGITRIALKKRGKKGEFAGGPVSFKIEGLIQLLNCEVQLMAPQTINAAQKKHDLLVPASLNKYQHQAYLAACALLLKP